MSKFFKALIVFNAIAIVSFIVFFFVPNPITRDLQSEVDYLHYEISELKEGLSSLESELEDMKSSVQKLKVSDEFTEKIIELIDGRLDLHDLEHDQLNDELDRMRTLYRLNNGW